jgi:hypothetical protein
MANDSNRFRLTGSITKERRQFVSLCLGWGIASAGRTVREVKEMLAEARQPVGHCSDAWR